MIEKSSDQNTKHESQDTRGGDISKQGTSTHSAETVDTGGRSSWVGAQAVVVNDIQESSDQNTKQESYSGGDISKQAISTYQQKLQTQEGGAHVSGSSSGSIASASWY